MVLVFIKQKQGCITCIGCIRKIVPATHTGGFKIPVNTQRMVFITITKIYFNGPGYLDAYRHPFFKYYVLPSVRISGRIRYSFIIEPEFTNIIKSIGSFKPGRGGHL